MNPIFLLLPAVLRNISCPAPWGDAWQHWHHGQGLQLYCHSTGYRPLIMIHCILAICWYIIHGSNITYHTESHWIATWYSLIHVKYCKIIYIYGYTDFNMNSELHKIWFFHLPSISLWSLGALDTCLILGRLRISEAQTTWFYDHCGTGAM